MKLVLRASIEVAWNEIRKEILEAFIPSMGWIKLDSSELDREWESFPYGGHYEIHALVNSKPKFIAILIRKEGIYYTLNENHSILDQYCLNKNLAPEVKRLKKNLDRAVKFKDWSKE